jgi:hypothetical protein
MIWRISDRRSESRHRVARIGTILCNNGAPPRYCLVTEMSDSGVRISSAGYEVPSDFVLRLPGLAVPQEGSYQVIWRLGNEIGAKLVE